MLAFRYCLEAALLANNVLFLVAAAAVLLGTLYPLLLDALGLGKISVGPPYFDTVFMPLMAPAIFLMGVGPLARWKEAELPALALRLRWAAGVTILAALATGWLAGEIRLVSSLGLVMAFWIATSVATDFIERIKPNAGALQDVVRRMRLIPRAIVGMMLAHLGVAAFCFGVVMVKTYEIESDVQMNVGDSTNVRGYTFTFRGVKDLQGPNYTAVQGHMEVSRNGQKAVEMYPQKRVYRIQQNPMTEAAIDVGVTRDLYVSLGNNWILAHGLCGCTLNRLLTGSGAGAY